jgi:dephospho-CoA kinase
VQNQISREERRSLADVVVDNSGDRELLSRQVESLWSELAARSQRPA